MTAIHEKLEQRRAELGMSKAVVARRAKVSLATVNRILSGKEKRPTLAAIDAIGRTLGVPITVGAAQDQGAYEWCKKEAERKARKVAGYVQGTMALEAQAVDAETFKQLVEKTMYELLAGSKRRLWDD